MMCDDCWRKDAIGNLERDAESIEALARAALPPNRVAASCYDGKYAGLAGYFAADARWRRDKAESMREVPR